MTDRNCRRCGTPLTLANARTFDGRWVGACRACEGLEQKERHRYRLEPCPTCGHKRRVPLARVEET